MPLSAEMPAPVSATTRPRARRTSSRMSKSAASILPPATVTLAMRRQLLPARHRRDDAGELRRTLGQRGGSRLQDDRALHLVELVVAHRAHVRPARPAGDAGPHRLLPAPARDDQLRVTARHLRRREDAALRALFTPRLAADVVGPAQLEELRDPADARDEGLGPLLEEGARPARQRRGPFGEARQPGRELIRQPLPSLRPADQRRREAHRLQDLRERALVHDEDGEAAADEVPGDVGLQVGEADHHVPGADAVQDLRRLLGEAHHPPRVRRGRSEERGQEGRHGGGGARPRRSVITLLVSNALTDGIRVHVRSEFRPERSAPAIGRFLFAYSIRISNEGRVPAQLLSRHWIITDAQGEREEVVGDGVVGQQPRLEAGEAFEYTSFCILKTPHGSMRGTYQMQRDDGSSFDAEIAPFALVTPGALN